MANDNFRVESNAGPMPAKPFTPTVASTRLMLRGAACIILLSLAAQAGAQQARFASPEAGAAALVEAVRAADDSSLRALLGPRGDQLVRSGDPIADAHNRDAFARAAAARLAVVRDGPRRAHLALGSEGWTMPIPLLQGTRGQWRFDTRSGEREILTRRIGRNELGAIQVALAIVDAEREFSARDSNHDGLKEYAARFTSRPGERDGLYWPTATDEPPSPLGPLLAAAAADGYASSGTASLEPYHGYLYRILGRQGRAAPGGAYDYFVGGKMIAGFAVIAWPARHGASGIMSFLVNQDGLVYEKNLGPGTATKAAAIKAFNPDPGWKRVANPGKAPAGTASTLK